MPATLPVRGPIDCVMAHVWRRGLGRLPAGARRPKEPRADRDARGNGEGGEQRLVERASLAGEDQRHRERDRCAPREEGGPLASAPRSIGPPPRRRGSARPARSGRSDR